MEQSHTDVLVIGAGPVGLAMAALLKQQNVSVRIIEKNASTTPYSKAIGMHARTLECMHALGIAEQLVRQGRPLQDFEIHEDGKVILDSSFEGIRSPYKFVLGLPQSKTEGTLHERLQQLGGKVEWDTAITHIDDCGSTSSVHGRASVVVRKKGQSPERITCNWLIGADGSRSAVRQMAGIEFPGGSYGNAFILGDVRIDWEGDKNKLQFFLSGRGYLLLIPMPDGMHRIIAQTNKKYEDFQGEAKPQATLEDLQSIVNSHGPGGIQVHSPQWLTCAPFYHRCASKVMQGRTLLIGDAYHLFSPLGAQGLNTGFQDAFNLAWKIAYIEKGWSEIGLIQSYCVERQEIADLIAKVTTKTTRYITATALHKRFLRKWYTSLMNRTKDVQQSLPRLMAGLLQRYSSASPIVPDGSSQVVQPGSRFPHFWVSQNGRYMPVAQRVHGTHFTWLLVARRLREADVARVNNLVEAAAAGMPYVRPCVVTRELTGPIQGMLTNVEVIEDDLGAICDLSGDHDAISILIRPDGFVACSDAQWDIQQIQRYFTGCGFRLGDVGRRSAA